MSERGRTALIHIAEKRAKQSEIEVDSRAKTLYAEVMNDITAEYEARDALWTDAVAIAEEAAIKANGRIQARCAELGIPPAHYRTAFRCTRCGTDSPPGPIATRATCARCKCCSGMSKSPPPSATWRLTIRRSGPQRWRLRAESNPTRWTVLPRSKTFRPRQHRRLEPSSRLRGIPGD
jgi:hypothetical protein